MGEAVKNYIETHSKSQLVGFGLTFLFGPLGLFYSSWIAALMMFGLYMTLLVVTGFALIGILVCWPLSMVIGFVTVSGHNKKTRATAALLAHEAS